MKYPRREVGFHSSDLTVILAKLNEISKMGTPEVKALVEDISKAVRAKLTELNQHGAPVQINRLRDSMVSDPAAPIPTGGSRKKRKRSYLKHAKKTAKG